VTLPRPVPANRTWFITRRCSQRLFLLLPQPAIKQAFEYCLARAANENGILLHAWMVMSDHYHLVLTDPLGRLPAFEQQLNSLVARILNAHWGRRGGFWEIGSYDRVEPLTDAAVLDKIVYTLANPVSAGLVARAWRWDGASSVNLEFGQNRRVSRPGFLRDGEPIETLSLIAPGSDVRSIAELSVDVRERLHAREREVGEDFAKRKRRFLGMASALALPWQTTPASKEAARTLRPRFATRDRDVMIRAIAAWKDWLEGYRQAWISLRAGVRDVVFPYGTYMLRVRYGIAVAGS
jgi:putative transposase